MSAENNVPRMFESDRDWLNQQPGMDPWEDGCKMLWEHVNHLLDEQLMAIFPTAIHSLSYRRASYCRRIWLCWRYHWRKAFHAKRRPVDGKAVAEAIQDGHDFLEPKKSLGGYPFRDVVLAQAVVFPPEFMFAQPS